MAESEFDAYASSYDVVVQNAISASGESVAFFADLKAELAVENAPESTRRILDFGCGVGNSVKALSKRFPGAEISGADPSAESISQARATAAARAEFRQIQGEVLPFESDSFDLVFVACVFHHIAVEERSVWLRELLRVLRRGGRLVLFEHNPYNPLTRQVVRNVPFDAEAVLLTKRETIRLLKTAGFAVGGARYFFFFPRILVWLRPLERFLGWAPMGAQYFVRAEKR